MGSVSYAARRISILHILKGVKRTKRARMPKRSCKSLARISSPSCKSAYREAYSTTPRGRRVPILGMDAQTGFGSIESIHDLWLFGGTVPLYMPHHKFAFTFRFPTHFMGLFGTTWDIVEKASREDRADHLAVDFKHRNLNVQWICLGLFGRFSPILSQLV